MTFQRIHQNSEDFNWRSRPRNFPGLNWLYIFSNPYRISICAIIILNGSEN
ncbi:MAG: hypothetical protein AB4426_21095 [Xenococcaceae cyanobacterium]